MSAPKHDQKPDRVPFSLVLRQMLTMRFKALSWHSLPAILVSLSQGLMWCFGVTSMQVLFDAVADTVSDPAIGFWPIGRGLLYMGGVMLAEMLLNNLAEYMRETHDLIVNRDLQDRLNRAAAQVDPVAYENTDHLENIEKAKQAIGYRSSGFTWGFVELFTFYLPFFAFMSVYLFNLRPILPLLFAMIAVPIIAEQIIRTKIMAETENRSAPLRREFEHYEAALCARETLKETRHLGASGFFFGKYIGTLRRLNAVTWKAQSKVRFYELLFRFPIILGHVGVVLLLVFSLRDGFITIGAFAAVLASIERLFDIVYGLVQWGYFAYLPENLAFSRNLIAFFRLPKRSGDRTLSPGPHGVKLRRASFAYPGREGEAVRDVTLEIAPGETVALVGSNGAGKSTLVKLLTGLYLPTSGSAAIGGIDTRELSMASLFGHTSGVFQKYQKYKLTARENIAISAADQANEDEAILSSADQAGVALDADSYPDGLNTMLAREFDGVDLSGGQWQRLAIARGLYRAHGFIVLDEPTAAIDPIEERHIYHQFIELSRGKTAVLVTHRLGATRIADRIVVVEDGRIAEEGKHEDLMARDGVYAKMFRSQAEWYQGGAEANT